MRDNCRSTVELKSICKENAESLEEKIQKAKEILRKDPDSSDNLLPVVVGKVIEDEDEEEEDDDG